MSASSLKYTAILTGSSFRGSKDIPFPTIKECREWAESYGDTADNCIILNRKGIAVARHTRSTEDNGMQWFRSLPDCPKEGR